MHVLGCGDAFGAGGRSHACFALRPSAGGGALLLDCGATALVSMRRHGFDPADVDAVVLSHLHGDHFGGLPFLILDAQLNVRRERPLTVVGPPGTAARLEAAMEALYPGSASARRRFETRVEEIAARQPLTVEGWRLEAFEVEHASGAPAHGLRLERDGRVLAYSGDTEWVESLVELADGAHLFVCEAYFADRDVRYHVGLRTLMANRERLRCERLLLTHMRPELLERLPALAPELAAAGVEAIEEGREYAV